jgi:hypothetical protein
MSYMADQRVPKRYLYHSCPRRGRGAEIAHGLTILELTRDFGLLRMPEIAKWESFQHGLLENSM